jgi:hypothetical protein
MKFHNPWTIRTPPGWSCLFVPPLNRPNGVFEVLSGFVDTDTYVAPVNFPFVAIADDGVHTLPKGTPLIQVIPFLRDEGVEGVVRVESDDEAEERWPARAGTGASRAPGADSGTASCSPQQGAVPLPPGDLTAVLEAEALVHRLAAQRAGHAGHARAAVDRCAGHFARHRREAPHRQLPADGRPGAFHAALPHRTIPSLRPDRHGELGRGSGATALVIVFAAAAGQEEARNDERETKHAPLLREGGHAVTPCAAFGYAASATG